MKKLLTILSTAILITPGTSLSLSMAFSNYKPEPMLNYSTNSFTNIIKIINSKFNNAENMKNKMVDDLLDKIVPEYYYKTVDQKEGNMVSWRSTHSGEEKVISVFPGEFYNEGSLPQKCLTQEKSTEIVEYHEFGISISESMAFEYGQGITGKIGIPLNNITEETTFKFGGEIGSKQSWQDSVTKKVTTTIPAQEIMQNPNTILHVQYIFTQQTMYFEGIASFNVGDFSAKDFRIPFIYFDDHGDFDYMVWNKYSLKDIIKILVETGHEKEIIEDEQSRDYSVLSVDDISKPKNVFVNLPITWSSQNEGSKLTHYEEKIK